MMKRIWPRVPLIELSKAWFIQMSRQEYLRMGRLLPWQLSSGRSEDRGSSAEAVP